MKAAKSWRRKGTSGRPDRLAPRAADARARNNNRVARLATTSSTTANKANSRLVAAKRLYRTLQFLCGRFLKLAGADVVSDSQPVHI